MSKETQEASSKQPSLYDSTSKKPTVQYKLVRLPLQNHVSTARKAVCKGWSQVRETIKSSVSSVRTKTQDQLVSLGVKNPATVMQASAVGTAGLVGLFMARNKSLFRRIFYPIVGGILAWETIYFSDRKNREEVTSVIKKEFSENFSREFSKNVPKEFSKHFSKRSSPEGTEDAESINDNDTEAKR